ncbi:MAG: potassium transporter Kup [Rhodospirillales bacterium]|jgi:KUP system potassium uptake protein
MTTALRTSSSTAAAAATPAGFWGLTLGSIGVVYGDIGTSPLYAFREAILAAGGVDAAANAAALREQVLGLLSLIVWALVIVVTLKYVFVLLRADNRGEGGTLSLVALAQRALGGSAPVVFVIGAIGAALFYGDALITPAISVLSAVEGLKLIAPELAPFVVPTTVTIILALFAVQSRGTAAVAGWFGPITLVWFLAMGVGGLVHIVADPTILAAANPSHAAGFLARNGAVGFVVLGAVFLAVTGAEALYADLGHFGRRPIQTAWLFAVFPALVTNYFGQGVLVLQNPEALENPFFLLYPEWALIPMVVLATMATIIASQAVITGAYSLTRQAIQLKLLPRMRVLHTSHAQAGQIYMPLVNALLAVGVVALVLAFGSSSSLATAYGIAVTGTMFFTTILAATVAVRGWGWPLWRAALLFAPLMAVDVVFLGANMVKILEGGYATILVAALVLATMRTWRKGAQLLAQKDRAAETPLADLLAILERRPSAQTPGTAVFLTAHPDMAPVALMHSLKHFKVLHAHNVILTVATADVPRVSDADRVKLKRLAANFTAVTLTFGYMDEPNVPRALALCAPLGWDFDAMSTSFLVSRRALKPAADSPLPLWQNRLFILLNRNAAGATDYFQIPAGRVVEIGTQVNL